LAFHSRIFTSVLALAGGLAAGAANGQQSYSYFQAGVSGGLMSVQADPDHTGSLGWMLGYRFNENVGVQVAGFGAQTPYHQKLAQDGTPLYDFSRYVGVQAVGYIPATAYWDLYGALGVGRSTYGTLQAGFGSRSKTDGLVEAGVRYQVFDHVALSGGISRVVDAQSTNGYLRGEVDF
jgi:hypothetical protein